MRVFEGGHYGISVIRCSHESLKKMNDLSYMLTS